MTNRTLVQSLRRRTQGLLLPAVAALLIAAAPAARAQDEPTGTWASKAGGELFFSGAAATDGTYLYVFGGLQSGEGLVDNQVYQQLRRYDPATDSWETRDPLEFPVYEHAGAYHDGKLYTLGGFNPTVGLTNAIQSYDIATNSWAVLDGSTLTVARHMMSAATLGGRIYVVGGYAGDYSGVNDEFDPATGTVTARASLPGAVHSPAVAALPSLNRLYAFGGYGVAGPSAATYEYTPPDNDPATSTDDSWTARAQLQDGGGTAQPRYGAAAFALIGRIFVTGGSYESADALTLEFSPSTDSWARRADMVAARYLHGAAAIGGHGYVYGGATFGGMMTGEEYTPPAANQAPVANAGGNRTVNATGPSGAVVTLDGSASMDPDGDSLSYLWTGPFGSASGITATVLLPIGTNSVSLTVTDPSDASHTDTVDITVLDDSPPVIESLTASPDTLWSPNHSMRQVCVSVSASDPGDADPTCEIVSVSSNQESGSESDWEITGALMVNLRAERSGGEARIYTITVRCTDLSGNSSTATVTVIVPHRSSDDEGSSASKGNRR